MLFTQPTSAQVITTVSTAKQDELSRAAGTAEVLHHDLLPGPAAKLPGPLDNCWWSAFGKNRGKNGK